MLTGPKDFAQLATGFKNILGDQDQVKSLMVQAADYAMTAEEQVTSVGEMKNVLQAIEKHFADDIEWISLVRQKLAMREANRAKYAVFQKRESKAENFINMSGSGPG